MSFSSARTRVAVLRGGPSYEYDLSLQTGAHVLSLLREMPEIYDPLDIFISKDGEWHRDGLVREPHHALRHVDVVWNGLHGAYGEDGQVQRLLDSMQIGYTGSSSLSSALAMNKDMAKKVYARHSLLTPKHELLRLEEDLYSKLILIFRNYVHPVMVKPVTGGSSIGVRLAYTFEELKEAMADAFDHAERVLVEELIRGREASCGVVEKARGEKLYALLPVSEARSALAPEENRRMEEMAKMAHQVLGLRHFSCSDFIIAPRGKIYILETNALPAFHEQSLLSKSLKETGWKPHDFVDHIIKLTI